MLGGGKGGGGEGGGGQRRLNKGVTIPRRQKNYELRKNGQANGVAFVILNRAQFLIFFGRR